MTSIQRIILASNIIISVRKKAIHSVECDLTLGTQFSCLNIYVQCDLDSCLEHLQWPAPEHEFSGNAEWELTIPCECPKSPRIYQMASGAHVLHSLLRFIHQGVSAEVFTCRVSPWISELFCSQAAHLHFPPRAGLEQQAILARSTGKKRRNCDIVECQSAVTWKPC